MGDISDKAKSFLKKFSSPFGSSRKFKGQGHLLGGSSSSSPQPISDLTPSSSHIPPTKDHKQRWIEKENEQRLQHGDWRKQQQEKWAKEKNIPIAQIPHKAATFRSDSHPKPSKREGGDQPHVNPSHEKHSLGSGSASGSSSIPSFKIDSSDCHSNPSKREHVNPSGEKQSAVGSGSGSGSSSIPSFKVDSSEVDHWISAVESKEELAVALSTFLSAEPGSAALDILLRLLRNIVREPYSEKFRKIRMGNPKIKDAIGSATDLLEGLGFRFSEAGGESWAIMDEPVAEDIIVLRGVIALVESQVKEPSDPATVPPSNEEPATANSATPAIDRQLRVFFASPDSSAATIQLPESFYELSVLEIKSEAARRKKKLEESEMLIPRSYREKQAAAARQKYKFTVIRIQFPDGMIIQGVFLPREPTNTLYEFVRSALASDGIEFELFHPSANKNGTISSLPLPNGSSPTMAEADLVPTALLKFKPVATGYCGLRPDYASKSEPLTATPF